MSLFEIAFDHVSTCEHCELASNRICPTGRALFDAAYEKCQRLNEPPRTNDRPRE